MNETLSHAGPYAPHGKSFRRRPTSSLPCVDRSSSGRAVSPALRRQDPHHDRAAAELGAIASETVERVEIIRRPNCVIRGVVVLLLGLDVRLERSRALTALHELRPLAQKIALLDKPL